MDKKGLFVGGNFWDGRATGQKLGNPAADQAQGPFINPKEQALPESACVVYRVCTAAVPAHYPVAFTAIWGQDACAIDWPANMDSACAGEAPITLSEEDRARSDSAYDSIALSIAAYEDSPEVNAFSSKYDATFAGTAKLSKEERRGYALFRGKAKCANCHPANGQGAVFTDYTFDNLGVPQNLENPAGTAPGFADPGLGGFLQSANYPEDVFLREWGKQKVPTLRNVDLRPDADFVKAYSHNGYFKTLEGIVHFYNTRDIKDVCPAPYSEAAALAANCWPAPEIPTNVNTDELGDLKLSTADEAAVVAFLKTLSDGYFDPISGDNQGRVSAAETTRDQGRQVFLPFIHD